MRSSTRREPSSSDADAHSHAALHRGRPGALACRYPDRLGCAAADELAPFRRSPRRFCPGSLSRRLARSDAGRATRATTPGASARLAAPFADGVPRALGLSDDARRRTVVGRAILCQPPNDKSFPARVYTEAELPSEYPDDMPVLVSEVVVWEKEFRCFVLDRRPRTLPIGQRKAPLLPQPRLCKVLIALKDAMAQIDRYLRMKESISHAARYWMSG